MTFAANRPTPCGGRSIYLRESKPIRVLVLVHEYPPVGGGGGRVAQDVCQGLAARGHEVHVLTAHHGDLPRRADDHGVTVHRLPSCRRTPYKAGLRAMACYVLAAVAQEWRLIRHWRPDVIHAHFAVPAGGAAWLLGRLTGIPYVITAHLGDVPGGVPEKTGRWFRWAYPLSVPVWRGAALVTAVSQFTKQLAETHYPGVPVRVIPNGVDVAALRPPAVRVHQPPRIVFAGRFAPQKNPVMFAQVLARLKDLPWECTMLGDGALKQEVETLLQREGLTERCDLPGWVTPEEVLAVFGQSDILFMPSRSEGLPVVGVQALAKGLAVVASAVGGFLDIVEEGQNGHLFPPADEEAAQGHLRALLTSPGRLQSYREHSLQLAERFDLQRIVTEYESALQTAQQGSTESA